MKRRIKRISLACCVAVLALAFSACDIDVGGTLKNFAGGILTDLQNTAQSVSRSETSESIVQSGLPESDTATENVQPNGSSESVSAENSSSETVSAENSSSESVSSETTSTESNSSEASADSSSDASSDISSDASSNGSSSDSSGDSSSSSTDDSSDSSSEETAEKVLVKEETDTIGHKVAYYSDGTWEDMGRVTPLEFFSKDYTQKYGYSALSKEAYGEAYCSFYDDLYEAAIKFSSSTQDVPVTEDGCTIALLFYGVSGISADEALGVWKIFRQDNPQFYWLANYAYTATPFLFYLNIAEEYATASSRTEAQTAIEAMVNDCDRYLSGKTTQVERALTIYDYVLGRIEYAYESDGVTPSGQPWAHNIDGAARYQAGVCESYAETFDYLCELFGLNAVTVVGMADNGNTVGGHAWNILQLDGEWYTVDATWGDGVYTQSGSAPKFSEQFNRAYFGMPASQLAQTHTPDQPTNGLRIEHQFALPTLSETGLFPVLFTDTNGAKTMEKSIDDVFKKMTNAGGRYAIELHPHSKYTQLQNGEIYLSTLQCNTAFPKVSHLTVVGRLQTAQNEGYYYISTLKSDNVTLGGNVTLQNVVLQVTSLSLSDYALTCGGDFVRIQSQNPLTGNASSALYVETDVSVNAIALPYVEVRSTKGYLTIRGKAELGTLRLTAGNAQTLSENDVTIQHLHFSKEIAVLYLNQLTEKTTVTIENIYGNGVKGGYVLLDIETAGAGLPTLKLTGQREVSVYFVVNNAVKPYSVDASGTVAWI